MTKKRGSIAFAQPENKSSKSFGIISVGYNPVNFKLAAFGESGTQSFNSVNLEWANANRLAAITPFYIQYGVGAQWTFKKVDSQNNNFLSFKVPVSLLYNIQFGDSKCFFAPYAGLDAVVYALGKCGEQDFFKTEDAGGKMSRFNLDWHAGGQFMFGMFHVKVAYEGPIIGFYSENGVNVNTSQVNIGVGIVF